MYAGFSTQQTTAMELIDCYILLTLMATFGYFIVKRRKKRRVRRKCWMRSWLRRRDDPKYQTIMDLYKELILVCIPQINKQMRKNVFM